MLLTAFLLFGVEIHYRQADGAPAPARADGRVAYALPDSGTVTYGRSVEGRPLRAWRIGDPGARRSVVLLAAMHGDEPAPTRILRTLHRGPQIGGVDLWVVPVVNPDGLAAGTRQNARGVDLNRNFAESWVRQTGEKDSGPSAASEPETQALSRFLRRVGPDRVVSYHQPLYGVDTYEAKQPAFTRRIARALDLPLRSFDCRGGCHGTLTQWFNARQEGVALTVEYGRRMTRGAVARAADGVVAAVGGTR